MEWIYIEMENNNNSGDRDDGINRHYWPIDGCTLYIIEMLSNIIQ